MSTAACVLEATDALFAYNNEVKAETEMLIKTRTTALCLVTLVISFSSFSRAAGSKPTVSLILSKAACKRLTNYMLFICEARLDNASGKDLTVRSNFYSAFDGLELVVTDKHGKILAQQSYLMHQSPYSFEPREFKVKQGITSDELRFPIPNLQKQAREFRVRLVGTLLRSSYQRILSTETIEVKVTE